VSLPSLALSANVATRERHQRDIETVMLELSHRSKNLLSVVQSMARQISRHTVSFDEFDHAFAARIQALAGVHDLLIAREWKGAGLREVIGLQLAPFLQDTGRIALTGPDLTLRPKAVEQLGLFVHELATNSTKYGALSSPNGRLDVRWKIEGAGNGGERLHLEWQEHDGPPVMPPQRNGFGYSVIMQLVPRALRGQGHIEFLREGIRCTLDMPIATAVVAGL